MAKYDSETRSSVSRWVRTRLALATVGLAVAVCVSAVDLLARYFANRIEAATEERDRMTGNLPIEADELSLTFTAVEGGLFLKANFGGADNVYEYALSLSESDVEAASRELDRNFENRSQRPAETVDEYQHRIADLDDAYWVTARTLSDGLLGPVNDILNDRRIVIVADGALQHINFAALPRPGCGVNEPLLLTNEVVYGFETRPIEAVADEIGAQKSPVKKMLIVADPVFSEIASFDDYRAGENVEMRSGFAAGFVPQIPGTGEEADYISSVIGADNAVVLKGSAAERENVLAADIAGFRSLHIATHGTLNENDPMRSGLLLAAPVPGAELSEIRVFDIMKMRLNADMVVLSGCETGRGRNIGRESVSLKSAFLKAGARTVISSLWKVDDAATKDTMKNLYRAMLVDGSSASAALRRAQINLFRDPRFRSPFYWSAFTVTQVR